MSAAGVESGNDNGDAGCGSGSGGGGDSGGISSGRRGVEWRARHGKRTDVHTRWWVLFAASVAASTCESVAVVTTVGTAQ